MKNNDLVSVVIPIFNVEKYLEKCVNSLVNQIYKNLEIILVDDGSTDNSGNIANELSKSDNRIKVYHKKNGGLSNARNFGIKQAKGKYIGFIDSDDYIENEMYEFLYNNLIENKADISICGRFVNYDDGRELTQYKTGIKKVMDNVDGLITLNSFKYFDMSACDKLYEKSLFNDIEFPYGLKCEDYYTMYKLFDKSRIIVYESKPMYHYYQREGSISRNKIMDTAFIDASKSQVEYFNEYHPELMYVAYTSYVFANITHFNRFLKYNIECNEEIKLELKREVKKYLKYVLKNPNISRFKKVQALIFSKNINLYKFIKSKV